MSYISKPNYWSERYFVSGFMFRRLKNPRVWIWLIFINVGKTLDFLTVTTSASFNSKITFSVLETSSTSIFILLETSRADWPKSESGGTKNWKTVKGIWRDSGPLFFKGKKQWVTCEETVWQLDEGKRVKITCFYCPVEKWP